MVTERSPWRAKIFRGISVFSATWLVRLVVGFGVSVAMYRYFGPARMGVFMIATSVYGVLTFIVLETDMVVVPRLSASKSAGVLKRIVAANYVVKSLNKVSVAALLFGLAAMTESFYQIEGLATLIGLLGVGQLVSLAYGPIGPEVLQGLLRYREYFFQSLLAVAGQVVAIGLTVSLHHGLVEYLIYTILADAVTTVYGWWLYVRLSRRYGWSQVTMGRRGLVAEAAALARASVPVSLNQLMYKSYLYVANLFAGKWYEPSVVGYLGFVANVINKANAAIHSTLSVVFLPLFAELKKEDDRRQLWDLYERGYHSILIVGAAGTLALVLFARELTLVIGGVKFLPAVVLLQLLALQLIFRVPLQVLRMIYFAFEKTWALFGIFAVKTGVEIALLWLLTVWLDERGIVLAQVASYVVYAAGSAWVGLRLLYGEDWGRRCYELSRDLGVLLAAAVSLIVLDFALAPTLLPKLAVTAAGLVAGALWVRASQMAGRRTYLVGTSAPVPARGDRTWGL